MLILSSICFGDIEQTIKVVDAGGGSSSSADYSNSGHLGGIGSVSQSISTAIRIHGGYTGQISQPVSMDLRPRDAMILEGDSFQLNVDRVTYDDGLISLLSANDIIWSANYGPITGISSSGMAQTGLVSDHTTAEVQAIFDGFSSSLALTVLDMTADTLGIYAGDGIADVWQILHFGLDNPDAAPDLDPDGDGQDNLFEFKAGLIPTNSASFFLFELVAAQPKPQFRYGPITNSVTYTMEYKDDLQETEWNTLTEVSGEYEGANILGTDDTAETPASRFYRVILE